MLLTKQFSRESGEGGRRGEGEVGSHGRHEGGGRRLLSKMEGPRSEDAVDAKANTC
jgi:hypothetical protein